MNVIPGLLPMGRHWLVMGSNSSLALGHKHRKLPSWFSHRASPHSARLISHSFTSEKERTGHEVSQRSGTYTVTKVKERSRSRSSKWDKTVAPMDVMDIELLHSSVYSYKLHAGVSVTGFDFANWTVIHWFMVWCLFIWSRCILVQCIVTPYSLWKMSISSSNVPMHLVVSPGGLV